jgi:hypothetical protein
MILQAFIIIYNPFYQQASPCRISSKKSISIPRSVKKPRQPIRIDFIDRFQNRGMKHIVKNILSRLSGRDLHQVT